MLRLSVLLLILFGVGLSACAQQPFFTDDADVTAKGRFHFELSNQFSLLQDTAFPNKQQNALVYQLNYGLRDGLEISIDSPYLVIINALKRSARVFRWCRRHECCCQMEFPPRSGTLLRWPALTMAYAVEVPTGDSSTQLGSGVFDYRLIAIAQKTLSHEMKLRINQGVLFSGNTLTAWSVCGRQGVVYLAGVSLVRRFAPRFSWVSSSLVRELRAAGQAGQRCSSSSGENTNDRACEHRLRHGVRPARRESPCGMQVGLSIDF